MTAAEARPALRRLAEAASSSLTADIYKCSLKKQTGVSLKYMMAHGACPSERSLLQAAQFLQQELPIRLAHRVMELENLPFGLSTKAPVLKVRDWYVESFRDIRQFPAIETMTDERRFTELLHSVKMRHNNVMPTMAMGVNELKLELEQRNQIQLQKQLRFRSLSHSEPQLQHHQHAFAGQALPNDGRGSLGQGSLFDDLSEIHQFLDRFYMSRIGIRMLIGQHVALHNPSPPPHYIGLICTNVSPVEVAQNAVDDARSACMRTYGSAPEVEIYGDPSFTFAYVPTHLHQMLFELVKNSLRAVQERFADSDHEPPPIRIVVADGLEDVTIKLSDEGGGIPRSGLPRIWTYLYSTAKSPLSQAHQDTPTVMAGYGYGLPISRLYARYFGGDLQVVSMEGYGTDVYLHLNRLGNVQEPLP